MQAGTHRLVVGAHYGMRDWLAQRITAVVMALYTIILLVWFCTAREFSYAGWAGMFAQPWMKMATFAVLVCLAYHAWVGMRDMFMDYVKPIAIRLTLQALTIVYLLACLGYAIQILWRV